MSQPPSAESDRSHRLEQLIKYLSFDKENLSLLLQVVELSMDLQHWDNVERYVSQGLKAHPLSPELNAHAGFYNLREGKIEKAKDCFGIYVKSGLDDTAVLYNWAYSHYLLQDYSGAEDILLKIADDPIVNRQRDILIARCKFHFGDIDGAVNVITPLCESEYLDSEAEALLSILLCDKGLSEKSLYHANRVLQNDDPSVEAYLARGAIYLDKGSYEQAYADFCIAVQTHPELGRAWSGKGQIELYNFEIVQARSSLEKAAELMPGHIGTWHALGWVRMLQNDIHAAKVAFESAYALDRSFGETHGGLASVYALLEDDIKADQHRKLAEKLDPGGVSMVYAQLVMLNRAGKTDEATALIHKFRETEHASLGVSRGSVIDQRINDLTSKKPRKLN